MKAPVSEFCGMGGGSVRDVVVFNSRSSGREGVVMKNAIIGCGALLVAVSACSHAPPTPSVEWNGEIPPLCPVTDPHLGPADRPGVYVLQIVDDPKKSDRSFAFVIFVAHGAATVQNLIGPIGKEDWPKFYNDVGVLGSARPGGFFCDGVVDER